MYASFVFSYFPCITQFYPWVGKIPGEGNGNPLQYVCLEKPMDRGAWWDTVHEQLNWKWLCPFPLTGQRSAQRIPVTTSLPALGTDRRKRSSNVACSIREKAKRGPFLCFPTKEGFYFQESILQLLSHYLSHSLLHTKWFYYHNCYCSSRPPTPAVSPFLLPSRLLHYISFPHTLVLILTVHQGPDQRSLFQEGSQGDMSVVSHNSYSLPSSSILLVDFSWNCACLHN